jgi:hypothetical protein
LRAKGRFAGRKREIIAGLQEEIVKAVRRGANARRRL